MGKRIKGNYFRQIVIKYLEGMNTMDIGEWIYIISFLVIIITCSSIIIIKFIIKPSWKKMRISTYFWFKRAKVKFKVFDSFVSHSFLVSPKRQYEVVYRLETKEGEIHFELDNQLHISTDSRKEGSAIITFSRLQPIITFQGDKAKNGECSVKVYKKR